MFRFMKYKKKEKRANKKTVNSVAMTEKRKCTFPREDNCS